MCMCVLLQSVNSFINPCSSTAGRSWSASAYLLIANSYCLFLSTTLVPLSSQIGSIFAWCSVIQMLTPFGSGEVCFCSCGAPAAHDAEPGFFSIRCWCWTPHLPWRCQASWPKRHGQRADGPVSMSVDFLEGSLRVLVPWPVVWSMRQWGN